MWTSPHTSSAGRAALQRSRALPAGPCSHLVCVAFTLLLLGPCRSAFAQQVEAPSTTTIPVSCTINGARTNDVSVTLSPDGKLLGVDGRALLAALNRAAAPFVIHDLAGLVAAGGNATPARLRKLGLAVGFDTQRLELQITLPPALQRVTDISVVENGAPSTAVKVSAATLSAQLSATAQVDLTDQYVTRNGAAPAANSFDAPLSM